MFCIGCGRRQAVYLSSWSDGFIQAFCGHEGTCVVFIRIARVLSILVQRARDPEYAAMLDAQPKPKGRGRKKTA